MRNANKVLGVVVAVIVSLAVYFGAYYATVIPTFEFADDLIGGIILVPRYTVGGKVAEFVFAPAHRLDVMLRPDVWKRPRLSF